MADQGDLGRRFQNASLSSGSSQDVEPMAQEAASTQCLDPVEQHLHERFIFVANGIAEMYRTPGWNTFTKTALASTSFYKASCDAYRRNAESLIGRGKSMQCKEMLSWIRNYNYPYVRKEDVENYLLEKLGSPRQDSVSNAVLVVPQCSPREQQADTMVMFSQALSIPHELSNFFQEACTRHSKRRGSHVDDAEASFRKRQRR